MILLKPFKCDISYAGNKYFRPELLIFMISAYFGILSDCNIHPPPPHTHRVSVHRRNFVLAAALTEAALRFKVVFR